MAIDDQIEQQAYNALNKVWAMNRVIERDRILRHIVTTVMHRMNWKTLTVEESNHDQKTQ